MAASYRKGSFLFTIIGDTTVTFVTINDKGKPVEKLGRKTRGPSA